jgi:hypothetical protein
MIENIEQALCEHQKVVRARRGGKVKRWFREPRPDAGRWDTLPPRFDELVRRMSESPIPPLEPMEVSANPKRRQRVPKGVAARRFRMNQKPSPKLHDNLPPWLRESQ